jgi:hypothetical protein
MPGRLLLAVLKCVPALAQPGAARQPAFAGQALDPKGLWGVIVVNAADAEAARALMEGA